MSSSQNLNHGQTNNHSFHCLNDLYSQTTINIQRWSENDVELRLGMRFIEKAQATYVVRKWSVVQG